MTVTYNGRKYAIETPVDTYQAGDRVKLRATLHNGELIEVRLVD